MAAQVVMVVDQEGTSRFWLAASDGRNPLRQIPNVEGMEPRFGPDGEIFFRHPEGTAGFACRVRPDGTGLRKVFDQPIYGFDGVSRDGRWIRTRAVRAGAEGPLWQAFPLDGGAPVRLGGAFMWHWSIGGDWLPISGNPVAAGRSYIVPLPPGEFLHHVPVEGLRSESEVAALPGARRVDAAAAVPGPSPDVFAFSRSTTQRNLYRIPIR